MYSLYVLSAAAAAVVMAARGGSAHRTVVFILAFWLLGGSIIHEERFDVPLSMLGGGIKLSQLICYLLLGVLSLSYVHPPARRSPLITFPFEKYFFAFFVWFFVVIGYHLYTGDLRFRDFRGLAETSLMVISTFLLLKRLGDIAIVTTLAKVLILTAAISSAVALVQFLLNPAILRVGGETPAFGDRIRSNGIYSSEYFHSYIVVAGLIMTLMVVRSRLLRYPLTVLLAGGIICSFHRMSWFITILLVVLYFVLVRGYRFGSIAVAGTAALFILYAVASEIVPVLEDIQGSSFYQSRLTSDTMTDRLRFYETFTEKSGDVIFLGAGTKKSRLYYSGMMELEMGSAWASGERGGIHNLYVEMLFLYGLPLLVIFCAFLVSVIKTFRRLLNPSRLVYSYPLLIAFMYAFMNLTNSFPVNGSFGVLLALVLGSSAVYASWTLGGAGKKAGLTA